MKRLEGNNRTAAMLVGVIVTMGALAWAAVPFYSWFCQVTGYGGTPSIREAGADRVLDQTINVRFDANTAQGMGWEFRPLQNEMTLRIGETGMAFYEAYNPTDHAIAGQASYNVAPDLAGYYFSKIQCFCFTEQVLQPGERVKMPVIFFVDPDIVTDSDANGIRDITLSYTFFEIDLPKAQAALPPAEGPNYN
ncbi:cytochrome c oxidase assembly protein [Defluviimonas sp. WL0075]|uniref:Cytochrome c oxidase assembly protein CtaG n=1 Tax=Albidovulum sediminicola TaxID=2984331 RepID=A0ABT2Z3A4_9RHOB|nr:cytochrome c oxidase assembly protein [Defluviimonas sp. WL0075]MCV2865592.1 cytochrome c oxidase assembly protein [Defluviimonas sp. WL0075]